MWQQLLFCLLLFLNLQQSAGLSEARTKRRQGEPVGPQSPTRNDSAIGLQNDYPNYDVDAYSPVRYRPSQMPRNRNFGNPGVRNHPQLVNIPEYTNAQSTPSWQTDPPKAPMAQIGSMRGNSAFVNGLSRSRTPSHTSGSAAIARTNPLSTFANAFRSAIAQPQPPQMIGATRPGSTIGYPQQPSDQPPQGADFRGPINQDYDMPYGAGAGAGAQMQIPMNGGYMGVARQNGGYGYSYRSYIERQSRRYPVMIYTLVQCVPCNRAKHLLATTYPDVPSHYLELVGVEDWQRQLQADLHQMTGQVTFPYIFVCGDFIGGASNLFEMHKSGQLRQVLNNCMPRQ